MFTHFLSCLIRRDNI